MEYLCGRSGDRSSCQIESVYYSTWHWEYFNNSFVFCTNKICIEESKERWDGNNGKALIINHRTMYKCQIKKFKNAFCFHTKEYYKNCMYFKEHKDHQQKNYSNIPTYKKLRRRRRDKDVTGIAKNKNKSVFIHFFGSILPL